MKNIVVALSLFIYGSSLFSQTESNDPEKKIQFGFNLGLNHSNLQTKIPLPTNAEIKNGTGFRLGLLMEYFINKNLSISPKAELSFNDSKVLFTDLVLSVSEYEVLPLSTELMTHLIIKSGDGKLKPYLLFGPNFKIPLPADAKSTTSFPTNPDLAVDFGIGLEKALKYFHFAPELRYSYGLLNVNKNPMIQSLYYHNITLTFNFKG